MLGANYWASHAGTRMWTDWRPDIVEDDLRRLSEAGLQMLRVFPLWPVFQPIQRLYGGGGAPVEVRFGEEPLPDDDCGQAGMSAEAMDRFRQFCDLAEKHGLKLNIGLLTGWMSGRLHVPPALEGRNVLTDPWAIRWELRFVRHFVRAFRDHPAVAAWDLGNECNCMGATDHDGAYLWAATIVNAIRAEDRTHPVISGMHGLAPEGTWSIDDQAELTDVLTTHPYPVFTPHCDQDPVNTIRTIMHSTAESRLYADIGGKPCLCQEIGTLGPVIAGEAVAADFIRACLFSLWANDCHGLVWWCAHEQSELTHAPYDWHAVERELGLLRVDKSPKPVMETIGRFRRMLEGLPFRSLPPRTTEAVCILTQGQDPWGVAYSAGVLAKQAGFDLQYQYATQPIRNAALYLLPCLSGHAMIPLRRLTELLEKVQAGATLYISLDSGLPSSFEPIVGLEPQTRERRREFGPIALDGIEGAPTIPTGGAFRVRFSPTRAEVLGSEPDGGPAFSLAAYGRGRVYFLSVPMEVTLTRTPGAFHAQDAPECWRVYRAIAQEAMQARIARKQHPMLGVTEHRVDEAHVVLVAVNYSPDAVTDSLDLSPGWTLDRVLHGEATVAGEGIAASVPGNDGLVVALRRG